MNIKEQENQLVISLNLRIIINIIAYLSLAGFVGYRLYLVSRTTTIAVVSGIAVPRLKINNYEALSSAPQATASGVRRTPISDKEPFD
jgi:hypothetical protein